MSERPVDVLGILDRCGADPQGQEGSQAWALAQVGAAFAELVKAARAHSADLGRSIALANAQEPGTVSESHPMRVSLKRLDAALVRIGVKP